MLRGFIRATLNVLRGFKVLLVAPHNFGKLRYTCLYWAFTKPAPDLPRVYTHRAVFCV